MAYENLLHIFVGTHDGPGFFERGQEVVVRGGIAGKNFGDVVTQLIFESRLDYDLDIRIILTGGQLWDCVSRLSTYLVNRGLPTTVVLSECFQGNDTTRTPARNILDFRRRTLEFCVPTMVRENNLLQVLDWPEDNMR